MRSLFEQIRAHLPDSARALMETASGQVLTYGDIVARSGAFANALVASGVQPGDRVAAQVEKCPDAIFLYLACLRTGAVFLPLNTAYTLSELRYFFDDAEPRLIVCDASKEPDIRSIAGAAHLATLGPERSGSLPTLAAQSDAEFKDISRTADELAAILYTSGTTGRSKGAMLTHRNLASNAHALVEAWRFSSSDVLIHALPVFHTHGLFVAINTILLSGGSLILLPRFDPDAILAAMPRATCFMGVPTYYARLLQHPGLTRKRTAHMRLFVSGSAPLSAATHAQWLTHTGHAILERYGMTETSMNTSNPYDGQRMAGTVGLPLPGVSLRITDTATGRPVADGETGMIEVKGPNVFPGYWRMPEKTKQEFRDDGYFITGDLGRIDDDGYVSILGRSKELIISGGLNVYPKEVETEIDLLDAVVESAVIGLPHPDLGEAVTAVVVAKPGLRLAEADVVEPLDTRIARFKQPKKVVFVDELPRNTMGKVEKNRLREAFSDLYANWSGNPPQSTSERAKAETIGQED